MGSVASLIIILTGQFLKRDPSQIGQLPYGEQKELISRPEPMVGSLSLGRAAQTRQFWVIWGIWFCLGFCSYAIVVHIVPHAIELGISTSTAANILATAGGVSILGRVVIGNIADRIGGRTALIIAFALMAITLFWLISAKQLWMLLLFAAVFGFAYGGCDSPISPLVATLFGLHSHGLLIGILGTGFTIGAAAGPYLAGYVFDIEGNYQAAFLIFAIAASIGLIFATLLRPLRYTKLYQDSMLPDS
jgi:MFS family permease